jgi:hypothetical protein
MDGMERSSGSFIKDSQKRKDCMDEELINGARRRGAVDKGMVNYDAEKTYRVVRMKLQGYSMSIPYQHYHGGIGVRKLHYETIEFGGNLYRCAKDHQENVIYIDIHAMEEAIESSS